MRISKVDDQKRGRTTLQVEGVLRLEGAELLECLCLELREKNGRSLVIDLDGLTFLDHDSASVLRRLKAQPGIVFTGLQLFTRQMIEG